MSIWACMAFHLAGEPFHAGSRTVGMLGLCGVAGAVAASGTGRYVPRLGIRKMSAIGAVLQLLAWTSAATLGHTYAGIVAAIILLELGAQFTQLSNQSGCLAAVPDAPNRANTIFMTSLFLGGSIATFCARSGLEDCRLARSMPDRVQSSLPWLWARQYAKTDILTRYGNY